MFLIFERTNFFFFRKRLLRRPNAPSPKDFFERFFKNFFFWNFFYFFKIFWKLFSIFFLKISYSFLNFLNFLIFWFYLFIYLFLCTYEQHDKHNASNTTWVLLSERPTRKQIQNKQ